MCDGWLQISACRDFMINHPLKVPFLQGIHLLWVPCWGLLGVLVSGCLVGELQSQEATLDDPQASATPRAPSEVDPQQVLEASMRLFDDGFFHAAKLGFVDWLLQFPDHAHRPAGSENLLYGLRPRIACRKVNTSWRRMI